MKKIFLLIVYVIACVTMSAQKINIYKNGEVIKTYAAKEVDSIVFVAPPTDTLKNLLPGEFSINSSRKVRFTKSNLYWDGNAYHFEENQTDYPTTRDSCHIGHFFWANRVDIYYGAEYQPYAETYSYRSRAARDSFWADGLSVDGTDSLMVLSGGLKDDPDSEWYYLIFSRDNAADLYKCGVTVTNNGNDYACLIIAPDDFNGTLQESYTLEEVNALGLVCLPAAGSFCDGEKLVSDGSYWTDTSDSASSAKSMFFDGTHVNPGNASTRQWAKSIRLVREIR